jgi:hypothetical protein
MNETNNQQSQYRKAEHVRYTCNETHDNTKEQHLFSSDVVS